MRFSARTTAASAKSFLQICGKDGIVILAAEAHDRIIV
jgi:hypothetical protein